MKDNVEDNGLIMITSNDYQLKICGNVQNLSSEGKQRKLSSISRPPLLTTTLENASNLSLLPINQNLIDNEDSDSPIFRKPIFDVGDDQDFDAGFYDSNENNQQRKNRSPTIVNITDIAASFKMATTNSESHDASSEDNGSCSRRESSCSIASNRRSSDDVVHAVSESTIAITGDFPKSGILAALKVTPSPLDSSIRDVGLLRCRNVNVPSRALVSSHSQISTNPCFLPPTPHASFNQFLSDTSIPSSTAATMTSSETPASAVVASVDVVNTKRSIDESSIPPVGRMSRCSLNGVEDGGQPSTLIRDEKLYESSTSLPTGSPRRYNGITQSRLPFATTMASCSTYCGTRPSSAKVSIHHRVAPASAGVLPSVLSQHNQPQSPFFSSGGHHHFSSQMRAHSTGGTLESSVIASNSPISTSPVGVGLRLNRSRTSFGNVDENTDTRLGLKSVASEYGMAKHLHTELVMSKHNLKGKLTKFQRLLDRAFNLINLDTEDTIVEGATIVAKVMSSAWIQPKIGHDLAYGLCDYLREMGYFDILLHFYLSIESKQRIKMIAGRALEECFSGPNRDYTVDKGLIEDLALVALSFKDTEEERRVGVSLFESLFKQSSLTNAKLIEMGALDYVLHACKGAAAGSHVFRHAALALANLSMYSETDCQQRMIAKNAPDWLFLLASSQDDVTRYYACLAICSLVSNKEIEAAVIKSGTLCLVEPFLLAHKPSDFANSDHRHNQGRPREWLEKLLPLLSAKRRESRSLAAFHFAVEAGIKKDQDQLEVFEEIGATEALRQVASYPEEVGPKFAAMALEIIGAEIPYSLTQQVPLWSIEDVQYWVTQIGFESYAQTFADQKVDGDLLLLLTPEELEHDINMKSALLRKRFLRELDSLKMAADFSCVDETHLDRFLVSIRPQLSVYTYLLLDKGADRSILPSMSDEKLKNDLGIKNPIDRARLIQALEECKHIEDMEIAILSRHIDIFISYRRSTGNQLASLIKVLLQLRGYKVFIDVDRLYAGNFDSSLLKNIQAAKHFVLVLTPQALQRCLGDDECQDWVHKEVICALEHQKNIIPIFDPQFEWPDEPTLPVDMRQLTRLNGVRWVHEYQDACVDKLEKFIKGELNAAGRFSQSHLEHSTSSRKLVNFRSQPSKQTSNSGSHSGQLTPSHSVSDGLLEALCNHRSRTSSREELNCVDHSDQVVLN